MEYYIIMNMFFLKQQSLFKSLKALFISFDQVRTISLPLSGNNLIKFEIYFDNPAIRNA